MINRTFGRTGISISEVGCGTWAMGGHWGPRDDRAAVAALCRAFALGVTFVDTALIYGSGRAEQLVGEALKTSRAKVFVATKIPPKNFEWFVRKRTSIHETFPPDHIIASTEKSLRHLGVDCIDLQQFHIWSDRWLNDERWQRAVEHLKESGKVRFFGVSIVNEDPNTALELVTSGLVQSVQVIYNIFDQRAEEKLFPLCQKHCVAVIARCPFDEGSLTGKLSPHMKFARGDWRRFYFRGKRLEDTCKRVAKLSFLLRDEIHTLSQAALKFCLSHPAVSTVIPGMRTMAHVEENCQASDGKWLHPNELQELHAEHAWPRNFYPRAPGFIVRLAEFLAKRGWRV